MTCSTAHDLGKGRKRKDGKRLWKCKRCGRSAVTKAGIPDVDAWLVAVSLINIEQRRQNELAREVMES